MVASAISRTERPRKGRARPEPAEFRARHMMTAKPVTVAPDTSVKEVASLMAKNRISAVPVLDGPRLVGVVSEADLIQREELGTSTRLPERRGMPGNADFGKSMGLTAREVMTPAPVTIEPDAPLSAVVERMQIHGVRRLPVMEKDRLRGGERLVGVVSRADIVRLLAERPHGAGPPASADDDVIRLGVLDTLLGLPGTSPWLTEVDVVGGVVTLRGTVEDEASLEPSRAAIAALEHVRDVDDRRTILQPY